MFIIADMQTAVEVRGICKALGGKSVLDDVSFAVGAGEAAVLLGRSGSGKTTLLRAVNMLAPPDGGVMRVCGETIQYNPPDERQLKRLRRRVAMVFQHFNLWPHLTVLQNATLAPVHALGINKNEANERAKDALAKVGMIERAGHFPSQLSGGQKQRAGIARALAMRPEVILFDEPTSALDPEMVGEVLAVIRKLSAENVTMIIVTHEMGFAREAADRAVFLEQGAILADGKPDEVFNDERLKSFLAAGERFRQ